MRARARTYTPTVRLLFWCARTRMPACVYRQPVRGSERVRRSASAPANRVTRLNVSASAHAFVYISNGALGMHRARRRVLNAFGIPRTHAHLISERASVPGHLLSAVLANVSQCIVRVEANRIALTPARRKFGRHVLPRRTFVVGISADRPKMMKMNIKHFQKKFK